MGSLKASLRRALHRLGVDVVRYDGRRFVGRKRLEVIKSARANVVLDVGAGSGQFAQRLRNEGFTGRIVSFEPVAQTFADLQRRSSRDFAWVSVNLALGDHDGEARMNMAGNLWSSSLLPMAHAHEQAAPQSAYVGEESVRLARLDSLSVLDGDDRAYLKVDVQGTEGTVLDGAAGILEQVVAVELELSLVELYEGQELLSSLYSRMRSSGFALVWLGDAVFRDPRSDEILAVDAIFVR